MGYKGQVDNFKLLAEEIMRAMGMNMEKKLKDLFKVILEEVQCNEKFKNKIYKVLENGNNNAKRSRKRMLLLNQN